ncbi:MAG: MBL fold metallo-hydrolase [Rhodospirillales bacterium]|nr:MBL fold metallo-hydrolase [Rhodospirillales bacterium]
MPAFKLAIIPVTVFQQNCALLWDAETLRAIVVDPGGEPGRILDAIGRLGLKVEMILLTHGHLDHAGGAKALKGVLDEGREAPVPLLGPDARDAFLLDGIEEAQKAFGMGGLRNVRPDRFLAEGDTVEAAGLRLEVLYVPGHTPGHIVFFAREQKFAVLGDTLFKGSVGRTDFPYGDGALLLAGIHGKLLPLGDDVTFICGHGPGSTIGAERAGNPFLQG